MEKKSSDIMTDHPAYLIGAYEGLKLLQLNTEVRQIEVLIKLRENKKYRQIPGCQSFGDLCAMLGLTRAEAYRKIEQLEAKRAELVEWKKRLKS